MTAATEPTGRDAPDAAGNHDDPGPRKDGPARRPVPKYVQDHAESGLTFSVCSLVKSPENYARLLDSFAQNGFTPENSEFLAADNRTENRFDGFSWTKAMLGHARGRYLIFCHDDVELISDGHDALLARLAELDTLDPNWLIAGVAGGRWRVGRNNWKRLALHISDFVGDDRRHGNLPCRVESLDECFILMRRSRPVVSSYDLSGFHFYGPDICLQAEFLGGTAWAIDFHLRHHGRGLKGPEFHQCRQDFIRKHAAYQPKRHLHCTTGVVYLAGQEDEKPGTDGTTPS
jgi:hypothetical protein